MAEEHRQRPAGEYADVVASILDRDAEMRRSAARPPEPKRSVGTSWVAVAVLAIVFVVVWAGTIRELTSPPPPQSPEEAELSERVKTFAAAQEVRRFERENGRLPGSLAEVGLEDTGLRLVVLGDRWRLEDTVPEQPMDVRSDEDPMSVIFEMGNPESAAGGGGMR